MLGERGVGNPNAVSGGLALIVCALTAFAGAAAALLVMAFVRRRSRSAYPRARAGNPKTAPFGPARVSPRGALVAVPQVRVRGRAARVIGAPRRGRRGDLFDDGRIAARSRGRPGTRGRAARARRGRPRRRAAASARRRRGPRRGAARRADDVVHVSSAGDYCCDYKRTKLNELTYSGSARSPKRRHPQGPRSSARAREPAQADPLFPRLLRGALVEASPQGSGRPSLASVFRSWFKTTSPPPLT